MRTLFVLLLGLTLTSIAHAVQPSDPKVQSRLQAGKSAFNEKKYPEALKAFKDAVKLPGNACDDCYIWLARAYERQGQYKEAVESCDKAISCAPTDLDRATAHNARGFVLLGKNEPNTVKEAEAEFRKAIELDPKDPAYHFNLAASLLRQNNDDAGVKELDVYLASGAVGSAAETARAWKANPRRARGNAAPEFSLTTLQGDKITLSQLAGKVVVLDFWATWCPPCRASVPELKEMIKKYPGERLAVISVSADEDDGKWRDFVATKKMEWPQYRDSDGSIRQLFGVQAFPTYLVIDEEGIIKQRITGMDPRQSIAYRLRQLLESMRRLNQQ